MTPAALATPGHDIGRPAVMALLLTEGEFQDFLSGRRLVFRAPGEEVVVPRQPRPEVIPPPVNGHRRVTVMVTVAEWDE